MQNTASAAPGVIPGERTTPGCVCISFCHGTQQQVSTARDPGDPEGVYTGLGGA